MSEREAHEMKWRRHIEKLNTKKKPENGRYEIKTPIPSNPDRCFVCNVSIPPEEEYLAHLVTEQHQKIIESNTMYNDID